MNRKFLRASVASLVAGALLVPAPPPVYACGPFFPTPVFTDSVRPDVEPAAFAAGRIGIVPPSYETPYLVVAYRYFAGAPLSPAEQKGFVRYWNHNRSFDSYTPPSPSGESVWEAALSSWQKSVSRTAEATTKGEGSTASLPETYQEYENCLDDAYRTAARTLEARTRRFGADSPAVRSWVGSQIRVFHNCSLGSSNNISLPAPPAGDLPQLIRDDAEYQTAAAYFYAGAWNQAEQRFTAISEQKSSPWRATAALVAARCEIRKATLGGGSPDDVKTSLSAAEIQLRRVRSDPAFASIRAAAARLNGFVEFRLNPRERLRQLSKVIETGSQPAQFFQDLDDYTQLYAQPAASAAGLREASQLTDWIESYGADPRPDAEAHRIARWRQTHSVAWLVAALADLRKDTPGAADLLEDSRKVPPESPAYLTLAFDRDRFLASTGDALQAREDVDRLLALPHERLPLSARNQFLAFRMKLARSLDEFLATAPRTPAGVDNGYDPDPQPAPANVRPMFDRDSAHVFSLGFPLIDLVRASESSTLPSRLRRDVVIAAWTRAILLDDDATARSLAPVLVDLAPELQSEFAAYETEQNPPERKFEAVMILLRTPAMRPVVDFGYGRLSSNYDDGAANNPYVEEKLTEIDSYRNNWWAGLNSAGDGVYYGGYDTTEDGGQRLGPSLGRIYPGKEAPAAAFLNPDERVALEKESRALAALPMGPDWMAQRVFARAKSNPDDPRLAEALHLVVHMTRFCSEAPGISVYSKRAFRMLHRRFPASPWAAKTPYWF